MSQEFLDNLKKGAQVSDPRQTMRDVVAAAAAAPPASAPDSDNDDDAAERARLVRIKTLVNEVHAERPDPRLLSASTLLQQAIDQEDSEG